ncbi:protein of unknown function DUF502 [PinkBerry-associated phage LS06-2018-MD08]|nr:protein of unknown function DUF502 [PinkBerry-associated phage LS06-2018-MD08]
MKKTFISGLLVTLPIILTCYVLYSVFKGVDDILQPLILRYVGFEIIGLGFVLVMVAIFIVGLVGSNFIGKWLLRLFNKVIDRVPLANKVYGGINEVVGMIGDSEKESFKDVALVEYPKKGMYAIGFITNTYMDKKAIFIPTTPNVTSGVLIYTNVYELLDISVEVAMKKVISMGVLE